MTKTGNDHLHKSIQISSNFDIASFFPLIRSISKGWLKSDHNSYRLAPTVCYCQFLAQWACHVPLKAEIVSNLCIRSQAANWLSFNFANWLSVFDVLLICIESSEFFPKQCGNTWGSYGSGKRPGWLDGGSGRVARGFHRYFRGFVLACSFRL